MPIYHTNRQAKKKGRYNEVKIYNSDTTGNHTDLTSSPLNATFERF